MEVLESTLHKETTFGEENKINSDDSVYTESEKESVDSDESSYASKGVELLQKIKSKITDAPEPHHLPINIKISNTDYTSGRRPSGPTKQISSQAIKANISNINELWKAPVLSEECDVVEHEKTKANKKEIQEENDVKPRKSILKNSKRPSLAKDLRSKTTDNSRYTIDSTMGDDTETSGYRSNSSSRQNELSETESDYGYSTITEAATPKKLELRMQSNYMLASGVLPEESWTALEFRDLDSWSDEDDEEIDDTSSKMSLSKNLYERHYYLNSLGFMTNFVDNFIINLGSGLGLTQDVISNALTQGASIYCDTLRNGSKVAYEIYPALLAAWPNAANQWIIRERKIVRNPRTNYNYQWPTKYMVSKAIGFGCLLVPVGFRPKRGVNPEQNLQWRIIFPAAERYLESCLAHSQMRCYLFALALQKTFMENETSKIGIDANHIKNHLFWQCEDNYARWPEDRLGESLRIFLRSFYTNFVRSRFPNYFIETCNEFKSIPKPLLLKLHRRLGDILEAPVMHVLHAIDKLKYTKRDFYPSLNCHRLYEILTCKYPLRLLNPNLPPVVNNYSDSSDNEDENETNFWDKAKARDKQYKWAKERQRQIHERRKMQINNKKHKSSVKQEKEIKQNVSIKINRLHLIYSFKPSSMIVP